MVTCLHASIDENFDALQTTSGSSSSKRSVPVSDSAKKFNSQLIGLDGVGTNRPSRNISVVPFLQDGMEPRSLRYCAKTKLSHFHCSSVSMYASPVSTTCSLGDAAQNARSMGFTDAILGEVPDGPCRASCWKRLVAGTIKRAS